MLKNDGLLQVMFLSFHGWFVKFQPLILQGVMCFLSYCHTPREAFSTDSLATPCHGIFYQDVEGWDSATGERFSIPNFHRKLGFPLKPGVVFFVNRIWYFLDMGSKRNISIRSSEIFDEMISISVCGPYLSGSTGDVGAFRWCFQGLAPHLPSF